jgi:predicted nucleic acid-binding protein
MPHCGGYMENEMMYTLDANIFLRDANPYDPDHATSHLLLEQLERQALPIVVPLFVLVEVAGVLGRELRDSIRTRLFVEKMRTIPTISFVACDEELTAKAAELAADRALRGADALYVAVAQQYACQLVTLDQEMRMRAAAVVTVRPPAEVLADIAPS